MSTSTANASVSISPLMNQVVHRSENATFLNDVQLGWYPADERNLDLCRGYIFTARAVGKTHSSVEIFEHVYKGFLSVQAPNRHVVVATYGHGKSHLALTMANFFGREADSPHVKCLLEGVRHAAENKAPVFADFKKAHQPFLVLRLRGDSPEGLPQQVVRGLATALDENEATRGAKLGLWFEEAVKALNNLKPDAHAVMETFLASHQSDVAFLRAQLEAKDPGVYELCLLAFKNAVGFEPNFSAAELSTLVENAADEWCGEGKPFSGLLILFDEFSAFVKKYASKNAVSSDSSLQDLLNGVKNKPGKIVFVAFAQYEPELTARLVYKNLNASDDEFDSLIKELNRLEKGQHYQLYSSMEYVVDAYLHQEESPWEELMELGEVGEEIADACDASRRLFAERYSGAQGWDDEEVFNVLGRGCFPLHPVTTAILCSSSLREVTTSRGVLDFVLTQLDARASEKAFEDGQPNWIYATELVESMGETLTEDDSQWQQYQNTVRTSRANVEDTQPEYSILLRALLLHTVARLKVGRSEGEFEKNLSLLSGLSSEQCRATLKQLADGGFIRAPTDGSGIYTFWPLGEDGSKVDRALRSELEILQSDRAKVKSYLTDAMKKWGWSDTEVSHSSGHSIDWAAESWLLPKQLLTAEKIREIVQGFRFSSSTGVLEAPRGYILRPFAANEDEAQWIRASAASLLDEALKDWGDAPPPVVLALPPHPQPDFIPFLLRARVLQEWKRDREKVREMGEQAFNDTLQRAEDEIAKALNALAESHEFVVPSAYSAAIDAKRITGQNRQLGNVLSELYALAYRAGVPGFFTQYKADTNNLRDAVMLACRYLVKNSMTGFDDAAANKPVARELRAKFLETGSRGQWGVMGVDGRLREPQNARVAEAWKVLDEAIPPGADEVLSRPVLMRLMNAPFGYDANTLTLLFSAWLGFNSHGLKISNREGRAISIEECLPSKPLPKEFFNNLCYTQDIRIARRDDAMLATKINELLKRERKRELFSIEEAENALIEWQEYSCDETNDPAKIEECLRAAERLRADMKRTEEYAEFFSKAAETVRTTNQLDPALKLLRSLEEPPPLGIIVPRDVCDIVKLRDRAQTRVSEIVELLCSRLEKLPSIHSHSEYKDKLERMYKLLHSAGETAFLPRVREAQANLAAREQELSSAGKDSEFVARLKSLKRENQLLEIRDGLRVIAEYSPHVTATQELMEETRELLQAAETEAQLAVSSWQTRLQETVDRNETRRLENEIQKRLERYAGTPEHALLNDLLSRAEKLEKYFEKLAEARREKPVGNKDLEKLARRLELLSGDDEWSESQKALAFEAKTFIEARVQQDVQEAIDWLEQSEASNNDEADTVRLMMELDKGRAFLPEEYSTRLKSLKRKVQKRIDDDELTRVEASFRKIKDKSKRAECLQKLQAIVNDGV